MLNEVNYNRTERDRGAFGTMVDLDTGAAIPRVVRVEEGATITKNGDGCFLIDGYIQAHFVDAFGRDEIAVDGRPRMYRAKGKFKFIPAELKQPNVVLGAPSCAMCGSFLVLAGDDLCPRCKAADRGQRHRFLAEDIASPLLTRRCEHKGCGRLATKMTGDEVIVSPTTQKKRLEPQRTHSRALTLNFERGMVVARHFWCDWHFSPPKVLDDKGEVVRVEEPTM